MQRKRSVVVQPTNLADSKLGMQNSKIIKYLKDAPVAVDTTSPYTLDLIDVSDAIGEDRPSGTCSNMEETARTQRS